MAKKSLQKTLKFEDVLKDVKLGNLSKIPDRLDIDLSSMNRDQFWALIELARLKSFGPALVQREFAIESDKNSNDLADEDKIVLLRGAVSNGDYTRANSLIESSGNHSEIALEKVRILVSEGRSQEASDLCTEILKDSTLSLASRGVCFQLLGQAQIELGAFARSKSLFYSALDTAITAGNFIGQVSARLFLAKQSAFERDFSCADDHLQRAWEVLSTQQCNLRWILGFARTRSQVKFFRSEPMTAYLQDLLVSARIAEVLGDQIYAVRSLLEAALMSGAPQSLLEKSDFDQLSRTIVQQDQTSGDLANWLNLAKGLPSEAPQSQTLQELLKHVGARDPKSSQISDNELREFKKVKQDLRGTSWICDANQGVLIDLCDGSLFYIQPDNPVARLIAFLSQAEKPLPIQEVFEGVWKIRWNPERHEGTLKVALSRFNKNPTSLRILRSDNCLTLNKQGYVCA